MTTPDWEADEHEVHAPHHGFCADVQMVVVRLGHYKGSSFGGRALRNALTLLMEAIPAVQ